MKPSKLLQVFLCLTLSWNAFYTPTFSQEKPNIVWLVSEDNSKHFLKLYDKDGASMPNIEALAKHGLVFNHAFSQAPVCSVARSTLISGCYAPRIGAQYHRRAQLVPMPEGLEMFPSYLRKAGYYTSNNAKEDYNEIKSAEVWDESSRKASYKNRQAGQPFFHVQNFGTTHEGQLHFSEEQMKNQPTATDPDNVKLFPYHPNTPTFRYTHAKYHDLHKKVDQQIGAFIQQLEADGLMENTFIFYYGDHGGVLPRSKGYIYESGLHVPLVVYVPEKWKDLVPAPMGSRLDGFVQFSDFGPTVLNLAGIRPPQGMTGIPFLGKNISLDQLEARDVTFSYADRFDEKYDLVRAVRKGKYKYIRNYQPFNFDGLHSFYRYRMLAYMEWRDLYHAGKLNKVQQQFFQPRAAEALYDLEQDPHETHNLATDAAFKNKKLELRGILQDHLKGMSDLSFYPEPYFLEKGINNPVQFGKDNQQEIGQLIDIADLSLLPFQEAKKEIKRVLKSSNPWERYWGLIVCSTFGKQASSFYKKAKKMTVSDPENLVRVRAAEFLALTDHNDLDAVLVDAFQKANSPTEANLILNTFTLLKEAKGHQSAITSQPIKPELLSMPAELVTRRLSYLVKGTKPRLLILTDIGGDPDDTQSMIRLLTHADQFELEGIIASASGTPGELDKAIVQPELIQNLIQAYKKVEMNLKQHSPYFPEARQLQTLVKKGNPNRMWDYVGDGHQTEASEWIIQQVDRADERPLNICIWGGQTDLAQALWQVKNSRSEREYQTFVSKIRIYDIADQDRIFSKIWSSFPGLWYILNKAPEGVDKREAVFRGMYLGGEEDLTSKDWLLENIIEDHGPLGALYPTKTWTAPNPNGAMKEGDTPSWFFFLQNGLNNNFRPEYGGWGGRFKQTDAGYYADSQDQQGSVESAQATVWRWRPDFQNEFAARMDWCVEDYKDANHAPQIMPNGSQKAIILTAKAGKTVELEAPACSDPDGDQLTYVWGFYPEASNYALAVPKLNTNSTQASFQIPRGAKGRELHLVLKVTDDRSPTLSAYQRYIIRIR